MEGVKSAVCRWRGVGVLCVDLLFHSPQVQRCVSWPVQERSHQMVSWLRRRGRYWLNTTRAGPRRRPSNTDGFLLSTLQPFYIGIMFIIMGQLCLFIVKRFYMENVLFCNYFVKWIRAFFYKQVATVINWDVHIISICTSIDNHCQKNLQTPSGRGRD